MGRPKKENEEQPVENTSKDKSLDRMLHEAEKKYSIQKASEIKPDAKIRTGIYGLDYVLSGGLSQKEGGYFVEFYGQEGSGKSFFSLQIIKAFQKLGKSCLLIDAENSYDKHWAGDVIGIDNDKLLVCNPKHLEEAGQVLLDFLPKVDLIVFDSIAGIAPILILENEIEEKTMGAAASVWATIVSKIYRQIEKNKTCVVFINQLRDRVGAMYGSPTTTNGGRALRHLYSARVEFKIAKAIEAGSGDSKERIGHEIKMHNVKNKCGPAFKTACVDFYYVNGSVDNKTPIFFSAVKNAIISKEGNTYKYRDLRAVGQDAFMELLTPEILKDIEDEIWKVQDR